MDETLAKRVILLVCRKTGLDVSRVSLDSRLLHDLGVTGDDAEELMEEFAQQFQVDLAEFEFLSYFTGEPVLSHFLWMLHLKKKPIWADKRPLTISDLVAAAERRRWSRSN